MQHGKLTRSWTKASAALPLEWRLMGVVLKPREADPVVRSASWVAWARGPKGERAEGQGGYPAQALDDLAEKLRKIRPDPNGWRVVQGGRDSFPYALNKSPTGMLWTSE